MDPCHKVVLETICKARKLILREVRADSCVLSTAIAVRAAAHFDLQLEPLHVACMVFNPWTTKQIENSETWPDVKTLDTWVHSPKGWSVGIGAPRGGSPSWPDLGHVIALGDGIFVDLSLDQASRPNKHMNLHPFWVDVENDTLLAFKSDKWRLNLKINGCFLSYATIPGTKFLQSKDWTDPKISEHIVRWIIKNVDLTLKKKPSQAKRNVKPI